MHKKLTAMACAMIFAMPVSVIAEDNTRAYGHIHLSVDRYEDSGYTVSGGPSKGSHIGLKGSMGSNLSDFKVVYKIEAGVTLEDGEQPAGLTDQRDSWVGMSSDTFGTFRLGTIGTPYKASGKLVDPLFGTSAEGRGDMKMMSALHGGTGDNKGRSTNTVRYDSRSIGGVKAVGHYNFTPEKNNLGLGLHYKANDIAFFVDYLNSGQSDNTAMKAGAKVKVGAASFAVQYEMDDKKSVEVTEGAGDQLFLAATYEMDATALVLTAGNNDNDTAYTFGGMHSLNKSTKGYVVYANNGTGDKDAALITAGMMVSF